MGVCRSHRGRQRRAARDIGHTWILSRYNGLFETALDNRGQDLGPLLAFEVMANSDVPRSKAPTPDDLPNPAPSSINPGALRDFRAELSKGEDVVDPATWAGSVAAPLALTETPSLPLAETERYGSGTCGLASRGTLSSVTVTRSFGARSVLTGASSCPRAQIGRSRSGTQSRVRKEPL